MKSSLKLSNKPYYFSPEEVLRAVNWAEKNISPTEFISYSGYVRFKGPGWRILFLNDSGWSIEFEPPHADKLVWLALVI